MKEIIKNNIGWLGFVIGGSMIFIGYYYNKNVGLVTIGSLLVGSSMAIDTQLKQPQPKIWIIYLITLSVFVMTFLFLIK